MQLCPLLQTKYSIKKNLQTNLNNQNALNVIFLLIIRSLNLLIQFFSFFYNAHIFSLIINQYHAISYTLSRLFWATATQHNIPGNQEILACNQEMLSRTRETLLGTNKTRALHSIGILVQHLCYKVGLIHVWKKS